VTLQPEGYIPRIADTRIEKLLKVFGAVEIVGSRWCGKTWAAMAHGSSITHIDDLKTKELAAADPELALEGERPHIVDEWQEVPRIWDAARRAIDEAGGKRGIFILTGSSASAKESVTHSGAGRIARLHMRPMSLSESGESSCSVSLSALFDGKFQPSQVKTDLRGIAHFICRGGWPAALSMEEDASAELAIQYIDTLLTVSAPKVGKDEFFSRRLIQSLARNLGGAVTYGTLAADIVEGDLDTAGGDAKYLRSKIESYLSFLKEQFIVEDLVGWDAPIKSRSRVRTKPKRYFVDPSISASLLGMNEERILSEMQVFGLLFEELCIRDLKVYASAMALALPEPVRYYRDSDGLEVDAIIELRDGRWGAIEIKLSEDKVDEGITNLLRLKKKLSSNPKAYVKEPAFLAVIVGKTDFCRRSPEGVYVFPATSFTV